MDPMRKRKRIKEDNPDRWLLTYADMITLLLAFFIVLYSVSQVDAHKFDRISEALQGILKGGPSILRSQQYDSKELGTKQDFLKIGSLHVLKNRYDKQLQVLGRNDEVMTETSERGLIIHIMESAMFDEGKADIKPKALEILELVVNDIKDMPNHIRVEGHTDDLPIHTGQFPSNWELSTARATNVVRYLIDQHGFPPNRISAIGYSYYRPVAPNNSIENRARNRRVDIVVLTMELSMKEPGYQPSGLADEVLRAF
jgi:chemotaxis protein MotB